jgi:hypothetical protein
MRIDRQTDHAVAVIFNRSSKAISNFCANTPDCVNSRRHCKAGIKVSALTTPDVSGPFKQSQGFCVSTGHYSMLVRGQEQIGWPFHSGLPKEGG